MTIWDHDQRPLCITSFKFIIEVGYYYSVFNADTPPLLADFNDILVNRKVQNNHC